MLSKYRSLLALFAAAVGGTAAAAPGGPINTDPSAVPAGRYTVDPTRTRVQFSVSHVGFTT